MRAHPGLDDREARALDVLCKRLGDDEFVLAERYTEWQVRAPSLESDLALSNIAQDELGHARLWYDVLADLGDEEPDLVYERDPETFRHSTMVELPFETGDWADVIVRSFLYDEAEALRLDALRASSHPVIADRVPKILGEEDYHVEHARNWLERLTSGEGHERVQRAVNKLFPHALTLFEPVDPDVEDDIVALGYRTRSLTALRDEWLESVVPSLESLDIVVPIDLDSDTETQVEQLRPADVGRDGSHTENWFDLYDEFTHTYRDLERSGPTTLMEPPER